MQYEMINTHVYFLAASYNFLMMNILKS